MNLPVLHWKNVDPVQEIPLVEERIKTLGGPRPPSFLGPRPDSLGIVSNQVEPTVMGMIDPIVVETPVETEPAVLEPSTFQRNRVFS